MSSSKTVDRATIVDQATKVDIGFSILLKIMFVMSVTLNVFLSLPPLTFTTIVLMVMILFDIYISKTIKPPTVLEDEEIILKLIEQQNESNKFIDELKEEINQVKIVSGFKSVQ